jgi:hypothetical protein
LTTGRREVEHHPDMSQAAVETALADVIRGISESLQKEGADVDVRIDENNRTIRLKLIRNRIVCEGCLVTADMAERRIRRRLAQSGETAGYGVETDWS